MYELGRYNFGNESLIDIRNTEKNNTHVVNHENVHRILCGSSSYGLLIIMMKKNRLIEDSHNWLKESLVGNMIRMQETIATAIELFIILKEQGKKEYKKKIEELRNNKTYYNYYRKLLFSNMKPDDEGIIDTLYTIGVYSLNIDLHKIPFEDFKNKKDFQRFIAKEGNNLRFLPNKRFETLFSIIFRSDNLDGVTQELSYLEEGTVQVDNDLDISKCAREAFKRIYSNSDKLPQLVERINTIDMHIYESYEGVSDEFMTSYPIDLNNNLQKNYKVRVLENDKFWDKFNKRDEGDVVMRFEHLLGGFEKMGLISLWDLKRSAIYATSYPIEYFDIFVKKSKCPIIFIQSKLFKRIKYKIRGLSHSLPVYLFMDGPIASQIQFILKHFKGGNYTYFASEGYITLVVFRGSYVLIQFIIPNLVEELESLLFKTSGIKFIEYEKTSLDKNLLNKISRESMKYTNFNFTLTDGKNSSKVKKMLEL